LAGSKFFALVGGDARARVPNGDSEQGRATTRLHRNLAVAGELERVAEQVHEDLADPLAVEDDLGRGAGILPGEADPLLHGQRPVLGDHRLDQLARIERLGIDRQPARLDLRQIEDLVDQAEQVAAPALDPFECPLVAFSGPSTPPSASVNPRIAFIGVRSSWLTLAGSATWPRSPGPGRSSPRAAGQGALLLERHRGDHRLVEVVGQLSNSSRFAVDSAGDRR
jgi:hypothetical protein